MKKLKLILLLAVLAVPFLQSCNSKIDQPSQYALATIKTFDLLTFYGELDNGDKIYIGDATRIPNYKPVDGQRAIIYFTPLETPVQGYKYNAQVYGIDNILTQPIVLLEDKEKDTLGQDNISIVRAWVGLEHLNIEFAVTTNGITNHVLNLVDNKVDALEEKPGYTTLDFRHNSKGITNGQVMKGYVCFKLPIIDGSKGLYIRYKPLNSEEYRYITVEPGKESTGE